MVDVYDPARSDDNLVTTGYWFSGLSRLARSQEERFTRCSEPRGLSYVTQIDGDGPVGARAYVVVDGTNAIVIVRGSEDALDYWWDIQGAEQTGGTLGYPGTHAGFAKYAESLEVEVQQTLEDLALGGVNRVWLTGHSLGGAVAQLLAWKIRTTGPSQVDVAGVYTYGTPGVGSAVWGGLYRVAGLESSTHRFEDPRDIVVCLPGGSWSRSGQMHSVDGNELVLGATEQCPSIPAFAPSPLQFGTTCANSRAAAVARFLFAPHRAMQCTDLRVHSVDVAQGLISLFSSLALDRDFDHHPVERYRDNLGTFVAPGVLATLSRNDISDCFVELE